MEKKYSVIVSGSAGKALLVKGKSFFILDVDEPENPKQISPAPLDLIFGGAEDLEVYEKISKKDAAEKLILAYDFTCALHMALIGLDSETSNRSRKSALKELEKILTDTNEQYDLFPVQAEIVEQRLKNVFYSRPFPSPINNLEITAELAEKPLLKKTQNFFKDLLNRQDAIQKAHKTWEQALIIDPPNVDYKHDLEVKCVREGYFSRIVEYLYSPQKSEDSLESNIFSESKKYPELNRFLKEWSLEVRS